MKNNISINKTIKKFIFGIVLLSQFNSNFTSGAQYDTNKNKLIHLAQALILATTFAVAYIKLFQTKKTEPIETSEETNKEEKNSKNVLKIIEDAIKDGAFAEYILSIYNSLMFEKNIAEKLNNEALFEKILKNELLREQAENKIFGTTFGLLIQSEKIVSTIKKGFKNALESSTPLTTAVLFLASLGNWFANNKVKDYTKTKLDQYDYLKDRPVIKDIGCKSVSVAADFFVFSPIATAIVYGSEACSIMQGSAPSATKKGCLLKFARDLENGEETKNIKIKKSIYEAGKKSISTVEKLYKLVNAIKKLF